MKKRNKWVIKNTRHHCLPKSRWWSNNKNNINNLNAAVHNKLHMLFSNKLFIEKIEMLLSIEWKSLTRQFKKELIDVLEKQKTTPDMWYIRSVIWNRESFYK